MSNEELLDLVELQKQAALDKEFGHPVNTFVGNVAEKVGGLASSLGYVTNSPRISQMGDNVRRYGQNMMPQSEQYTTYENIAEHLGQIIPAAVLGYATKSPYAASVIDSVSEIGTIINELQRQGYSKEEINEKLSKAIPGEIISSFANGTLNKIGLGVTKNNRIGGLPRKFFGGEIYAISQAADQPLQNLIYDETTRR